MLAGVGVAITLCPSRRAASGAVAGRVLHRDVIAAAVLYQDVNLGSGIAVVLGAEAQPVFMIILDSKMKPRMDRFTGIIKELWILDLSSAG
jgi:hypothetical protein